MRRLDVVGAWVVAFLAVVAAPGPAAHAVTYTWTGDGAADIDWSNPSNWGGAGPDDGESNVGLVFPPLGAPYASNNDLTGLEVSSLDVTTQLGDDDYAFTGNSITLGGPVTMASPESGSPNLVWQIPVVLGTDVTISASGRQTQLRGIIDLGDNTLTFDAVGDIRLTGVVSGTGNLIKNNGSALTIAVANTYTGSTTCNGGALYIADAAAFGATGTGTTFNGGFLGFNPGTSFVTSEPFVFDGGDILAYGTSTIDGEVRLEKTTDIKAFEAQSILRINGPIAGPGGLGKTGPGLLILNAPIDSYEGATQVVEGTLQINTILSGTERLTVRSGTTLQGNGASAGPIEVMDGGVVAPGVSPGEITSSGLMMADGATFAVEIDGPTAVSEHDRITVNGPVSLGGATLAVTLGYAPPDGQQFTLIAQLGDDPVGGTFADLAEGATFQVGGTTFGITYAGGGGNDVVLVAAPTPTPTGTTTSTPAPTSSAGPETPTSTPSPTSALVPSPTATGTASECTGDCDGDGTVSLDELVLGVGIAEGGIDANLCTPLDVDRNGQVTIDEVIEAVQNALTGCR